MLKDKAMKGKVNIHYWNQANFLGLEQLVEQLHADADYQLFAQYCYFRSKGLRKQAFKALDDFIGFCLQQPQTRQLEITLEMLSGIVQMPQVHQLMAYPLSQWFKQVLLEQKQNKSKNSLIYQWLAYLDHDVELYKQAYELDQHNQMVLYALSQFYLNQVDWQTHHLSESYFIGEIEHAYQALMQADFYLKQLQDDMIKNKIIDEYQYYKNLLDAWQKYCQIQSKDSFFDWCTENKIVLSAITTVYYQN